MSQHQQFVQPHIDIISNFEQPSLKEFMMKMTINNMQFQQSTMVMNNMKKNNKKKKKFVLEIIIFDNDESE